jgi:DTW domain-containing protein YfiP
MARSVVLQTTKRCDRCRFTPRWCICPAYEPIASPLQVDVLFHHREFHRPTSTGRLVNRLLPGSRHHIFRSNQVLIREAIVAPGRELWILHPRGEPVPADANPAGLQVLLLDGSWRESARMAQTLAGWGRLIRLPEVGESRNELRQQEHPGHYSTVESLIFLHAALGLKEAEAKLRRQFELHVYAGLRTRGAKAMADEFLAGSLIREAFPELLEELHRRRPHRPGEELVDS